MTPKSPVAKGLESHEIIIAKDQPEYLSLPALPLEDGIVATRWAFTETERKAVAAGDDILLLIHTFGQPLQPLQMTVVDEYGRGIVS